MRQGLVGQKFAIRIIEVVKLNYCLQCFERYDELNANNDITGLREFLKVAGKKGAETVQSKNARIVVAKFDQVA